MSILKSRFVVGGLTLGVALLGVFGVVGSASADEIRVASLEVKQRIQSMEQINVTAEKSVDESAPTASAAVSALLEELEELEGLEASQRD